MENILDIIYLYSMKEKLLDRIAISRILNLLFSEYNLSEVKELHFLNGKNDRLAYYSDDKLFIYTDAIHNAVNQGYYKSEFKIEDNLSFYEDILRKNLFILQVVFHEFEHVLQDKLVKTKSIEDQLINVEKSYISDTESILQNHSIGMIKRRPMFKHAKELYHRNYDISLLERLADINAFQRIIEVTDIFKEDHKNIYELQNLLLLDTKMKNYKNPNDKPTIRFFKNINKFDEVSDIDYCMEDISKEERLKLGLKIDADDYFNNKNYLSLQMKKRN